MSVQPDDKDDGNNIEDPKSGNPKIKDPTDDSNTIKDPDDWTTGDEEMTGAQRSYLKTLCEEAKEPFDDKLTKAAASKRIDELQHKTGRGLKTPAKREGSG
jgi:hypothetical protein